MSVKLVSVSPDAEKTMAYIARVSNPNNQDNEKFAGLFDTVYNITIGLFLNSHQ